MIAPEALQKTLEDGLPGARAQVEDLTGTQDHFRVVVVSDAFDGKLPLARHRMVYAALGSLMDATVHALTLQTDTPTEHAARPAVG